MDTGCDKQYPEKQGDNDNEMAVFPEASPQTSGVHLLEKCDTEVDPQSLLSVQ